MSTGSLCTQTTELFQVPRSPELALRREAKSGHVRLDRRAPEPLEALLGGLPVEVEHHDVTADTRTDRVHLRTKTRSTS